MKRWILPTVLLLILLAGCDEDFSPADTYETQLKETEDCDENDVTCDIYQWKILEGVITFTGAADHEKDLAIRQVFVNGVPVTKKSDNFSDFDVELTTTFVQGDAACPDEPLAAGEICLVCTVKHYCGTKDFRIVLTDELFAE